MVHVIDLSRIPLQCVRTIAPERGWGAYFHTFAVLLSTLTSTRPHCLLECGKGLFRVVYFYSVIIHAYILNGDIFHETEQIENDALSRSERSIEYVLSVRPGKVTSVKSRLVWVFAAV